ncbi:hypothetical protein ABPG74_004527 [Tetrahymena malaccensis]
MSSVSISYIDYLIKEDCFCCQYFQNNTKTSSNHQSFPQSIIGIRNYNQDIETNWEKYMKYIKDKYYDFQIINFTMFYAEQIKQSDKFSVMFQLINPTNSFSVNVLSYYNTDNISIEFYNSIEGIYAQENWKVEKFIEIYKKYNEDDQDNRLNIDQIITIADQYITRFYHQSTNNDRHYAEEFLKIYQGYKNLVMQKQYLY